jgi:tetratricopeptide (TPR) repeat protein
MRTLSFFQAAGVVSFILLLGCAGPRREQPPSQDEELTRLTRQARTGFDQGDLSQAVRLYEHALERAQLIDDAAQIGNAAYNLAVSLMGTGEYARAKSMLREAETALARAGENLADVLLVQARLAQLQGNHPEALLLTRALTTRPGSSPRPEHLTQAALIRGAIASARGDVAAARVALNEAKQTIGRSADPALAAGLHQLQGNVALLQDRPEAAARAFDRAVELWREAGHYRDLARALAKAGEAWEAAGNQARAAERLFRAARSGFAQEESVAAREWLQRASRLAEKAGDSRLQQRLRALESEWASESGPSSLPDGG